MTIERTDFRIRGATGRIFASEKGISHYGGWALVEGTGKRPLVPPDDPRHPHNRPPPGRPPPAAPGMDDDRPEDLTLFGDPAA